MKYISIAFFALTLATITSCETSSELVASWKTDEFKPRSFNKLVVFGLTPNERNRNLFEINVANALKADNIPASPSYTVFPLANSVLNATKTISDSAYLEAIKTGIKKKIEEKEVDGLLMMTLLDVQKEQVYVSSGPEVRIGGYVPYYGNMTPHVYESSKYYNYYAYSYATVYEDGYYQEELTYFIEFRLYDAESQDLIWVGQTKSVDVTNVEEEANNLARVVAAELIEGQVILNGAIVE